jgi:hypothetical protein
MQSRILQVTHLGNFQPCLAWHIVNDDHQGRPKNEGGCPGLLHLGRRSLGE